MLQLAETIVRRAEHSGWPRDLLAAGALASTMLCLSCRDAPPTVELDAARATAPVTDAAGAANSGAPIGADAQASDTTRDAAARDAVSDAVALDAIALDAAALDATLPDAARDAALPDAARRLLPESGAASDAAERAAEASSQTPVERLPPHSNQTAPTMLNGIALDEQGYLWVTDGFGAELLRLEVPGEKIVGRYGADAGVDGPDDLVIDGDFVYYTANWTLQGGVGKLDRRTGRASTFALIGLGTNPLAFLPSGKLLAGISTGGGGQLGLDLLSLGLTPNGLFEVDPSTNTYRNIVKDSKGMNAFCIPPDGFVYGPHGANNALIRIDLKSGAITTLRTGLEFVSAVRYNPLDQHLYALAGVSANQATLLRMALDGSDYSVFATLSVQPDALGTSADNFTIAPDGTFYVTRFLQPIVTRVSPDGSKIEDFHVGKR